MLTLEQKTKKLHDNILKLRKQLDKHPENEISKLTNQLYNLDLSAKHNMKNLFYAASNYEPPNKKNYNWPEISDINVDLTQILKRDLSEYKEYMGQMKEHVDYVKDNYLSKNIPTTVDKYTIYKKVLDSATNEIITIGDKDILILYPEMSPSIDILCLVFPEQTGSNIVVNKTISYADREECIKSFNTFKNLVESKIKILQHIHGLTFTVPSQYQTDFAQYNISKYSLDYSKKEKCEGILFDLCINLMTITNSENKSYILPSSADFTISYLSSLCVKITNPKFNSRLTNMLTDYKTKLNDFITDVKVAFKTYNKVLSDEKKQIDIMHHILVFTVFDKEELAKKIVMLNKKLPYINKYIDSIKQITSLTGGDEGSPYLTARISNQNLIDNIDSLYKLFGTIEDAKLKIYYDTEGKKNRTAYEKEIKAYDVFIDHFYDGKTTKNIKRFYFVDEKNPNVADFLNVATADTKYNDGVEIMRRFMINCYKKYSEQLSVFKNIFPGQSKYVMDTLVSTYKFRYFAAIYTEILKPTDYIYKVRVP